jgi:ATP-binding cassette, subfamily G (WHITE), member 2
LIASKFFIFMLFMFLCSVSSTSLALMISAICKTTDLSVMVLPLALEITRLFGGFFLAPSRLPKYFVWLDALSYNKYTFVGTALNELHGLNLSRHDQNCAVKRCFNTGAELIEDRGFDYINIGGCVGALIAYIIGCRFIAYLGVRFLKH